MNPAGTVKVGVESKEIFSVMKLLKEVDWTEPWIIFLMTFHGFITVLAVVTRNHGNIQAVLFCTLLLMVYFSEVLNEWAAKNWRLFARDQYFDSSGVFISIMFATPSLLNCLFLVCQWLWISGTLLIKAKQAQLRREQQRVGSSSGQVHGSDSSSSRGTPGLSGHEKCD